MKILRLSVALMLVMFVVTGCASRNNNNNNAVSSAPSVSVPAVNSLPDADDLRSGAEDLISDVDEGVSRIGDDLESALDRDEDVSGIDRDRDESLSDESVAAAMSTDFSEIGALSAEKFGWGSGGPTDDVGRPNGATTYQERYGKYNAFFIAPSSQNVYLTFDEGYENGYTPMILDTLKAKDATAVFFITLDFAKTQPDLVKRMILEGHALGNHSVKHRSFPEMPMEEAAKDIMELHDYVKKIFGYEMTLFRPPMGEFSEQSLAVAQSLGYKSIFWSFAYKDYVLEDQPLTIEALDTITKKCHPGAIYLLHAVSQTNAEILGQAIDNIRELGFNIASWNL